MRRILLLPVLLLALLGAAPIASAADPEEADESVLVEDVLEECELDLLCEEEAAEAADEAEEAEAGVSGRRECVLLSAKPHAVLAKNKLKLTIGYTASEPARADLDVHYGATRLGRFKRRLGRTGVLRLTRPLKGGDGVKRPLRIELDVEGTACPARRLVLVPKG